MHHDRGAETCLVGEHAPLAALGNGLLDGDARRAARHGLAAEGKAEDCREHGAHAADIGEEHDQRADDIQHRHEGNDPLCDGGDALPPTVAVTPPKNADFIFSTILLIWPILPMPKEARMAKVENRTARTLPMVLQCFLPPRPSLR